MQKKLGYKDRGKCYIQYGSDDDTYFKVFSVEGYFQTIKRNFIDIIEELK